MKSSKWKRIFSLRNGKNSHLTGHMIISGFGDSELVAVQKSQELSEM